MAASSLGDNETLESIYYAGNSGGSFMGAPALYYAAKQKGLNVTRADVDRFLEDDYTFNINRNEKKEWRERFSRPYVSNSKLQWFGIDTGFLQISLKVYFVSKLFRMKQCLQLHKEWFGLGNLNKFFLTVDFFTQRISVFPTSAVTGVNAVKALEKAIIDIGGAPISVLTDRGKHE